jgi:GNAT superfamily N-acetyltransferase
LGIQIIPVSSGKQLREFIHLPAKIHKGHKNWVPPIYMDERDFFNPRKNKSFEYSDTVLYLARKNGETVGRVMGIINHRYNDAHNEKHGRFIFLETYEDQEVAHALLSGVEQWAREKGMLKIVGPLGFTDKDPQGFLIEGFDQPIVIASTCNYPYMIPIMEKEGYTKEVDLVVYNIKVPKEIPEFYRKIYDRAMERLDVQLLEFERRRPLKPLIRPVLQLVNDTFVDVYGFAPFEEKEMDDFANRYLPLLDPRYIKVIVNPDRKVVGFIIGMPDISKGIIKSKGYVLPFGIFQIIGARKKAKQLNLLLGAIHEDYRGKGLDTILGVAMLNSANKGGMECIDSHLELESNVKVRAEMERMGGQIYKRYRIFQKAL